MGYRIEYNPELNSKYPRKVHTGKGKILLLSAAMLSGIILGFIGINNSTALKNWLLPGNPQVTEAAFSAMIADIRAGEQVGDAITAFCLEIMENAKMAK